MTCVISLTFDGKLRLRAGQQPYLAGRLVDWFGVLKGWLLDWVSLVSLHPDQALHDPLHRVL